MLKKSSGQNQYSDIAMQFLVVDLVNRQNFIRYGTLCHQCFAIGAADQLSELSGPGLLVINRRRPG